MNLLIFPSQVSVPFRIERAKEPLLRDYVFSCDVTEAIVPANGKLLLSVRFSPQTVGVQSMDYFTIVPVGNLTQTVLKVTGSCKGIKRQPPPCFQAPFSLWCRGAGGGMPQYVGWAGSSVLFLPPLRGVNSTTDLCSCTRLLEVHVQLFAEADWFGEPAQYLVSDLG